MENLPVVNRALLGQDPTAGVRWVWGKHQAGGNDTAVSHRAWRYTQAGGGGSLLSISMLLGLHRD